MRHQGSEGPAPDRLAALASWGARGTPRAVVLVLNGGTSVSHEAPTFMHLSELRMLPFAWAVRRRTRRDGVAVCRLRYRYRGWNGAEASPVADAQWALDEIRRRFGPVPVVLLGHSMEGRTAVHIATDPSVHGLVLLAPWLTTGDPVAIRAGVPVNVIHGDLRFRTWHRLAVGAVLADLAAARTVIPRASVSPEPDPEDPRWVPRATKALLEL